jgi:RNA polymerase sigma factor (sigma-70 family)
MEQLSDTELWARAPADPEAFGVLFERHARSVYNFCFRRTGDWSLTEDLVSAVFLETWRRRREVEITSTSASLLPWLLGVATNLLRNERRLRRRLASVIDRLNPHERQPDFADDVVGRLSDEQQMRTVLRTVERLPQHELDVITLYAWGHLSYEDIAAALSIPVGTVRSRLSRARASLRELTSASKHEQDDPFLAAGKDVA